MFWSTIYTVIKAQLFFQFHAKFTNAPFGECHFIKSLRPACQHCIVTQTSQSNCGWDCCIYVDPNTRVQATSEQAQYDQPEAEGDTEVQTIEGNKVVTRLQKRWSGSSKKGEKEEQWWLTDG